MRKRIEKKILSDYKKYYRLAYSYVKDEDDAMDVVQESVYKAIKECSTLKKEKYFSTWMYRIVVNASLDFIRKSKRELPSLVEYEEYYRDPYMDFDVMDSLNKLDNSEKSIIILRFFEDEKLETIAEILDLNISTVKSRLYRSLKKLRIDLESEEIKKEIMDTSEKKDNSEDHPSLDKSKYLKTRRVW